MVNLSTIETSHFPFNYISLFHKTFISWHEFSSLEKYPTDKEFLARMIEQFTWWEVNQVLGLALLLTGLRYFMDDYISRPLGRRWCLTQSNMEKMPESIWKGVVYFLMWSACLYFAVTQEADSNFLHDACGVWKDYKFTENYFEERIIPVEFQYIYCVQAAFYVHSIYATLYMDAWRKDSINMLIHHVLTILLLAFSYLIRYYEIGILVLLLHDFNDVLLEFTKFNVYLKDRNDGRYYRSYDILSGVGFLTFTISWAISRLYYYPLTVLYSTNWCSYVYHKDKDPKFFILLNSMMWTLFILNVWWFGFILLLLYKILTGQIKEIQDTREYEVENTTEGTGKQHKAMNGTFNGNGKQKTQ